MNPLTMKSNFIIQNGVNGLGVFASQNINKGDLLFELAGDIISFPTRTSIQLDKNQHVESEIGALINHHCQPSAKVDKKKHAMIALRDIHQGEEITFNYNENEDKLASPFICGCCGKIVQGKSQSINPETTE